MTKFVKYNGSVINIKEMKDIELISDAVVFSFYGHSYWYLEMKNKDRLPKLFFLIIRCLNDKESLLCDLDDLMEDKNYVF